MLTKWPKLKRLVLPLIAVFIAFAAVSSLSAAPRNADWLPFAHKWSGVFLTFTISWLIINGLYVVRDFLLGHLKKDASNYYESRKMHTQLAVITRVLVFLVILVAVAAALMNFDAARNLGGGLLASAGIAGIVAGLAAQKTLGGIFAGIQIALTQPIRIDDSVVVEGEWGIVEEITLTYVVIRIWDLRRLIVPIQYFIEKPFQNWTRESSEIIGVVTIEADFTLPVEEMEKELERLLQQTPLWNGKVKVLQVVESSDRTMTLRALMTANSAGEAWDLRCHVRRGLIEWMRREHPDALPRTRLAPEDMQAMRQEREEAALAES